MDMRNRVARRIGPAAALLLCAIAAWLATLVKWSPSSQELVPFAFLVVVLALGILFGRSVGVLGSVIAALVFAYSLYHPVHSLRVADPGARSSLAWMLLAGVTLSYLLLPLHGIGSDDHQRHS